MKRSNVLRCAVILTASVLVASLVRANSDGPPAGVFCANCHGTVGKTTVLSVSTSPDPYQPGDTLDITVSLSDPGMKRWGFLMTAQTGLYAYGTWLITDSARTQIVTGGIGTYVGQTALGTDSGTVDSSPGWSARWVAPVGDSSGVFVGVSGLAANGDGTTDGDHSMYAFTTVNDPPICPIVMATSFYYSGDVNLSGAVTSGDIIYLVSYVFNNGPGPLPCEANGDVNCNHRVDAADIIYLVGYVFKGGGATCDVCTLIPSVWSCP